HRLELAATHHAPPEIIEPDALAFLEEGLHPSLGHRRRRHPVSLRASGPAALARARPRFRESIPIPYICARTGRTPRSARCPALRPDRPPSDTTTSGARPRPPASWTP